jgi:hypothetical protein
MAVGNNSNAIYYSIYDGKICRQFREATPNSKTRVNKNGKTVFEEFYDYIDGVITSITTKDGDYGRFWIVTLDDGGQTQMLQIQASSGFANGFLKALPNVDLSSKVKLIPSTKQEGDKKKSTLFISQHGNPVKWFFTKENPNKLPPLEKKKVKGKEVWDDSEAQEFLEAYVRDHIVPKLPKSGLSDVDVPLPDEVDAEDLELEAEAQKVKDKLPV